MSVFHLLAVCIALGAPGHVLAADVVRSITGGAQATWERHPFWGLADRFAPTAGYDDQFTWGEAYVETGVTIEQRDDVASWRAGASVIATGTLGEDLFVQGDQGDVSIEDAYVGARWSAPDESQSLDLSVGRQGYTLGRGLLLTQGAGNGFERGAAVLSPRQAWDLVVRAEYAHGPWRFDLLHLDPDELPSGDTGTRLHGGQLRWTPDAARAVGLAWFRASRSAAPYPRAPVGIIDGGREGLETVDLNWQFEPMTSAWSFSGEAAWQRNPRIGLRAFGIGTELGYRFDGVRWTPRVSYSGRYFSGDDPATRDRLERFDPLFYSGSPATWSSGGNGSFAFYNANLLVHRLRLDLSFSARDFANVNFWSVRAAQANSPVQYGQAARLAPTGDGQLVVVSGFPVRHLTDEWYAEYTRVLSQHWFVTSGVAWAAPRSGIEAVVTRPEDWVGAFVNLSFRY